MHNYHSFTYSPLKFFQENGQDSPAVLLCHSLFQIMERYLLFIVLLEHKSINIDLLFKKAVSRILCEVCGLPALLLSFSSLIVFEVKVVNEGNKDRNSFPA